MWQRKVSDLEQVNLLGCWVKEDVQCMQGRGATFHNLFYLHEVGYCWAMNIQEALIDLRIIWEQKKKKKKNKNKKDRVTNYPKE